MLEMKCLLLAPIPCQIKRLFFKQDFLWWPVWWSVECLWECLWGLRVNERILVPLGHVSHSCLPVSWTLGGIVEELWQLLGTNKSLCIEPAMPGRSQRHRRPSCSHWQEWPQGTVEKCLRGVIQALKLFVWWLCLKVQEGSERITLGKNEAPSKGKEHLYRSSHHAFQKWISKGFLK